jgi:hypothetical protein
MLLEPDPTVAFVQRRDWCWLIGTEPAFENLTVVREDNVGSREVLIITNEAGSSLLKR